MDSEWAAPVSPIAAPVSLRERVNGLRLPVLLAASLGTVLAALALPWFTGVSRVAPSVSDVSIDLLSVTTCSYGAFCKAPLEYMAKVAEFHPYATMAEVTLLASVSFVGVVVVQCGARLLLDVAHVGLAIIGVVLGVITMSCASLTAYVFAPQYRGFHIEPTLAPIVLLIGCVLGLATLWYAATAARDGIESSGSSVASRSSIPRAILLEQARLANKRAATA